MMTVKSLIGPCAIAVLSTGWCVLAAVEDADVVEITETEVKFSDCPVAVQKTLQQEAVGSKLNQVVKASEDEKTIYKAYVSLDARDYEIIVAEDGTLLAKMLDYDDEITIGVNFTDCPTAVQKTLKRESRGAAIETVEKVVTEDRLYYVADAKIEGENYEIIVAEDGVLTSKLLSEENEEDETTEKKTRRHKSLCGISPP